MMLKTRNRPVPKMTTNRDKQHACWAVLLVFIGFGLAGLSAWLR